jgi:hypothetical protein
MTGTVKFIIPRHSRVAVLTERKDFSILELFVPDTVFIDDELHWEEHGELGFMVVTNRTKGTAVDVIFCKHQVASDQVGAVLVA